jgi:hypothetical protein
MMRYLVALLTALVVPSLASAACVWSTVSSPYAVKVVCGDGDEVAPTLVTEGLPLASAAFAGAEGIAVTACADATKTITSGTLKAYVWDDAVGAWARAPLNDIPIPLAGEQCLNLDPLNVIVPRGRIAYIPSVVVLSAGGITIYLTASP